MAMPPRYAHQYSTAYDRMMPAILESVAMSRSDENRMRDPWNAKNGMSARLSMSIAELHM